jgi:hypothetical protein
MAPDPIPILIGLRFDYICEILRYDEEYIQKVWSHYSRSATYPKPNRAEVHEHVIAPVGKGVRAGSEDRALSSSSVGFEPRKRRRIGRYAATPGVLAIQEDVHEGDKREENGGGSGSGIECNEVAGSQGVGIGVDKRVEAIEPMQSGGISNPHYQQEVSNQFVCYRYARSRYV